MYPSKRKCHLVSETFKHILLQNSTEKVEEKGKKENIPFLQHLKKKLHTKKMYLLPDS